MIVERGREFEIGKPTTRIETLKTLLEEFTGSSGYGDPIFVRCMAGSKYCVLKEKCLPNPDWERGECQASKTGKTYHQWVREAGDPGNSTTIVLPKEIMEGELLLSMDLSQTVEVRFKRAGSETVVRFAVVADKKIFVLVDGKLKFVAEKRYAPTELKMLHFSGVLALDFGEYEMILEDGLEDIDGLEEVVIATEQEFEVVLASRETITTDASAVLL